MIVIASSNKHKVEEISAYLGAQECRLIDPAWTAEETGSALIENALIKIKAALAFCRQGEWIFAEDTGLFVPALGGQPGVRSARYAGKDATYEQNTAKLLEEMKNSNVAERRASFRTAAVLAAGENLIWISCGELNGQIAESPRGQAGFGYDPIFIVPEFNKTLAEMNLEDKNKISHRGRAVRALMPYVKDLSGVVASR